MPMHTKFVGPERQDRLKQTSAPIDKGDLISVLEGLGSALFLGIQCSRRRVAQGALLVK